MLSLDNTYSEDELRDFEDRIRRELPDEELQYVAELKIDGVALSLIYENGLLITRRHPRRWHVWRRHNAQC